MSMQTISDVLAETENVVLRRFSPFWSGDAGVTWTVPGQYKVVFRETAGRHEVWVETEVTHFSPWGHGQKLDSGGNAPYVTGSLS